MPTSYVQYWQLRPHGLSEREVRGNLERRPDESWALPDLPRARLRGFLEAAGFDVRREIFVREVRPQKCFHLTQRAQEREPPEAKQPRWHERMV